MSLTNSEEPKATHKSKSKSLRHRKCNLQNVLNHTHTHTHTHTYTETVACKVSGQDEDHIKSIHFGQ